MPLKQLLHRGLQANPANQRRCIHTYHIIAHCKLTKICFKWNSLFGHKQFDTGMAIMDTLNILIGELDTKRIPQRCWTNLPMQQIEKSASTYLLICINKYHRIFQLLLLSKHSSNNVLVLAKHNATESLHHSISPNIISYLKYFPVKHACMRSWFR